MYIGKGLSILVTVLCATTFSISSNAAKIDSKEDPAVHPMTLKVNSGQIYSSSAIYIDGTAYDPTSASTEQIMTTTHCQIWRGSLGSVPSNQPIPAGTKFMSEYHYGSSVDQTVGIFDEGTDPNWAAHRYELQADLFDASSSFHIWLICESRSPYSQDLLQKIFGKNAEVSFK